MSNSVLYMSMSLDGFIAGPNEGPGNGLGDGGHRLIDPAPAAPPRQLYVALIIGPGPDPYDRRAPRYCVTVL